jgi:hypothetical protein
MLCVKLVRKIEDSGSKGFVYLCRFVYRWFGVSHKIIIKIVIFVFVKFLGTTKKKRGRASSIEVCHR